MISSNWDNPEAMKPPPQVSKCLIFSNTASYEYWPVIAVRNIFRIPVSNLKNILDCIWKSFSWGLDMLQPQQTFLNLYENVPFLMPILNILEICLSFKHILFTWNTSSFNFFCIVHVASLIKAWYPRASHNGIPLLSSLREWFVCTIAASPWTEILQLKMFNSLNWNYLKCNLLFHSKGSYSENTNVLNTIISNISGIFNIKALSCAF